MVSFEFLRKVLNPVFPCNMLLRGYSLCVLMVDVVWVLVNATYAVIKAVHEVFKPPPMKSVENEKAMVIGSGRGIGRDLAIQLSYLGATVICVDINEINNSKTVAYIKRKGGDAFMYTCDITKKENVDDLAQKVKTELGFVSMLFYCCGIPSPRSLLMAPNEDIHGTLDLTLTSYFWLIDNFLPEMKARNHGHIVALTSVAGLSYIKDQMPLCVAQFAVQGLAESLMEDLRINKINELYHQADRQICYLKAKDVARLHFAAAVIGAPEVVILEESTEYQKYSVRRAMYHILNNLRQRGHSIIISSSSVETLLPVSNRLAILVNGRIYDIDQLDKLVERHSEKGYTVVVQLKYKTNVTKIFVRYFTKFIINDSSEKLVNFQLLDEDLTYASVFEKMEILQEENDAVNSYIVSATPIDYIYNSIISQEGGHIAEDQESRLSKYLFRHRKQITPPKTVLNKLIPFETRFHLTKLKELPWSVIFDK